MTKFKKDSISKRRLNYGHKKKNDPADHRSCPVCNRFSGTEEAESETRRDAIGTLLWMVFWWVTQPVTLTVTAFLPVGVNAIFGMVEMGDVISQYASGSIILVFGSCLLTIPWATTRT